MDNLENAIRAQLEIMGAESVEEAIKKVEELGKALNRTDAEIEESTRSLRYYAEIMKGATAAEDAAVQKLIEETRVRSFYNEALVESSRSQEALKTVATSTASATGDVGRGILQLSYGVQDFTSVLTGGGGFVRALSSVQNNLPVLLSGLGVGAGLAGTISLVSVGFAAAIPIIQSFTGATSEAAEASKKLADEAAKMKDAISPEKDQTKQLVDSLTKGRAETIGKGIEQELYQRAYSQALAAEQEQLDKFGVITNFASDYIDRGPDGKFTGRWGQQVQDEANRLLTRLATDPSARATVREFAARSPGNFPRGFADELRDAEPDAQRAAREADAADEATEAERLARKEQRFANAKEDNARRKRVESALDARTKADVDAMDTAEREVDRLNDQGRRNEDAWRREQESEATKARHAKEQSDKAAARAADPSNQLRAQEDVFQDRIAAEAMRQGQAYGANPQQMSEAARAAATQLPYTGGDIVAAVQFTYQAMAQRLAERDREIAAQIYGLADDLGDLWPRLPTQLRRAR